MMSWWGRADLRRCWSRLRAWSGPLGCGPMHLHPTRSRSWNRWCSAARSVRRRGRLSSYPSRREACRTPGFPSRDTPEGRRSEPRLPRGRRHLRPRSPSHRCRPRRVALLSRPRRRRPPRRLRLRLRLPRLQSFRLQLRLPRRLRLPPRPRRPRHRHRARRQSLRRARPQSLRRPHPSSRPPRRHPLRPRRRPHSSRNPARATGTATKTTSTPAPRRPRTRRPRTRRLRHRRL
jgi:hypothetical protein